MQIIINKKLLLVLFHLFVIVIQPITSMDCFYTTNICPNENVTFWLYTRENQQNPIRIQEWDLDSSVFNPVRPLKVIIHGYTGHKDFEPNKSLRPAFFKELNPYIISVDYGPIVREPCYYQATTNYLVAANCTAKLLDLLLEKNIFTIDDIHVIGFSLGAQVAGAMGTFLKSGKLSRISGLDPARPLFVFAPNSKRLDKSDAHFVDVIHTDISMRGFAFPLGHLDFYPNGGTLQPGCVQQENENVGSCNHNSAPKFYAESITTKVGFWGYECPSIFHYQVGFCRWSESKHQELMGYYANRNATGVYYLVTNAYPPFARGPYPGALQKNSKPLTSNTDEKISRLFE